MSSSLVLTYLVEWVSSNRSCLFLACEDDGFDFQIQECVPFPEGLKVTLLSNGAKIHWRYLDDGSDAVEVFVSQLDLNTIKLALAQLNQVNLYQIEIPSLEGCF